MKIKFKKLRKSAILPKYGSAEAAGLDLVYTGEEDIRIPCDEVVKVPIGVSCEIPEGYFGMVCSRSGNVANLGLVVANQPGIVDSDYRGELGVLLTHVGPNFTTIKPGQRIAQMIIMPYVKGEIVEGDLSETERGSGGFGSTGK